MNDVNLFKRMWLRAVVEDDVPALRAALQNPLVMQYLSIRFTSSDPGREQWEWYHNQQQEGTALFLAAINTDTQAFMGVFIIYYFQVEHQQAECGYWLLPEFWGKGYATEGLTQIIDTARTHFNLHKLTAIIESDHLQSRRVLEKCGFVFEGRQREAELKLGKFISLDHYGLIF